METGESNSKSKNSISLKKKEKSTKILWTTLLEKKQFKIQCWGEKYILKINSAVEWIAIIIIMRSMNEFGTSEKLPDEEKFWGWCVEAAEAAALPPEVGRVSSLEVAMMAAATTSLTLLYRLSYMRVTQTFFQLSQKLTYCCKYVHKF